MLEFEVTLADHKDIENMQVRRKSEFFQKYQDDMEKIMLLEHFGLQIPEYLDRNTIISEFEKTNIEVGDKIEVTLVSQSPFHDGFYKKLHELSEYRIFLSVPYYQCIYLGIDIQDQSLQGLKLFTEDSIQLIKQKHKEMVELCKKDLQEKNKLIEQENIKKEIKEELQKVKEPQKTNILEKLKKLV